MSEEMDTPTCGRGVAAQAVVPERLAAVVDAVAGSLDTHLPSLDLDDPRSRAEHDAYVELAAEHRRIADALRALATRMSAMRDLPMGRHDPSRLGGPAPVRAYERLVEAERSLHDLLTARSEGHAQMLATMRGDGRVS